MNDTSFVMHVCLWMIRVCLCIVCSFLCTVIQEKVYIICNRFTIIYTKIHTVVTTVLFFYHKRNGTCLNTVCAVRGSSVCCLQQFAGISFACLARIYCSDVPSVPKKQLTMKNLVVQIHYNMLTLSCTVSFQ